VQLPNEMKRHLEEFTELGNFQGSPQGNHALEKGSNKLHGNLRCYSNLEELVTP